jgi:dolichyl-phosphate-mannose--protein O-mannosyl transferase
MFVKTHPWFLLCCGVLLGLNAYRFFYVLADGKVSSEAFLKNPLKRLFLLGVVNQKSLAPQKTFSILKVEVENSDDEANDS